MAVADRTSAKRRLHHRTRMLRLRHRPDDQQRAPAFGAIMGIKLAKSGLIQLPGAQMIGSTGRHDLARHRRVAHRVGA
jgi:hypothetical protein